MIRQFVPAFALLASVASAQDRISDFKWKSRLLIVSGAAVETVELLESGKEDLEERDLKVFVLSGSGKGRFPAGGKLAEEFVSRLDPDAGKPMAYLIGKDGRTTLKWPLGEFTLAKLYASIDSMPMRRREMRERGQ